MSLMRRCVAELLGLFVDDGAQALLIVGWVVVCCLLLRQWPDAIWTGPILFLGLAAIFLVGLSKPDGRR